MGSLSYQTLDQEGGSSHVQDITDEDMTLFGYKTVPFRTFIYIFLNCCTFGFPALLCYWYPHLRVKLICVPCTLKTADYVLLTVQKDEGALHDVCEVVLEPGHHLPSEFTTKVRRSRLVHQNSKTHLVSNQTPVVHRYFIYRRNKFVWDDGNDGFRRLGGLDNLLCRNILDDCKGISDNRRDQWLMVYGRNWIEVEVKGYLKLLVEEVLNPFYIFQILSVILWCLDEYIYYASCVVIISAISIVVALYETRRQSEMLREMAQSSDAAEVIVKTPDGGEKVVLSRDLVPGDIILIPPEGFVMPCDGVLINGTCIVNESMLTGESTPVQKSALHATDDTYDTESQRRHTLFCGTQVIQTRYYPGSKVSCVVVRTGFNTTKGELIHSILFPKEIGFKFYSDAMRFVVMLFGLAAIGMSYCVYLYVQRGSKWSTTLLRVLDIVTIIVPPALPAAMTVGTVYAQSRLKKKLIFCISPPRINFCGKLKLVCFDKTGTLTEDGLDLWCVIPTTKTNIELLEIGDGPQFLPEFHDAVADPRELPQDDPLLRALAACHSLTYIHGNLVGDPLDVKMFLSTGWTLEEPMSENDDTAKFDLLSPTVVKSGSIEVGIIREFEFTPQLQRMSVIVRSLDNPQMILYCKGAPEKIRSLCLPHSLPESFDKVLDSFTVKGYRVLALGYRKLQHMKWHQVQRVDRNSMEKDLVFCGLLVMQNSLKPATVSVIEELNSASVRSVMVTGDNMLTALSVARECGIIPSSDTVIIVSANEEEQTLEFKLAAQHYEDPHETSIPTTVSSGNNNSSANRRDSATIPISITVEGTHHQDGIESGDYPSVGFSRTRTISSGTQNDTDPAIRLDKLVPVAESILKNSETVIQLQDANYHFAMTGRTWSLLEEFASPSVMDRIVAKGTVYARMSPENKSQLVEQLQGLGYIVGMCGDGANDCSALKMAHVGISLSEAEASVAAPFTSKIPDISCVPNLIREGRCALVTSFGIFKYMALYSFVQFISVLLLYYHKTNLADTQFLYIDLGITTSIAVVMGRMEPYPKLVAQRPMGSLVSFQNIFSIIVQVLISAIMQIAALSVLKHQHWFVPVVPPSPDDFISACWEATTVFSVSAFQYLILALVFSKGPPFRKPFYTNGMFVLVYTGLLIFTITLTAYPPLFLQSFFYLVPFTSETSSFRFMLLLFPLINMAISWSFEQPWFNRYAKKVGRNLFKKKQKNPYKAILKELENDLAWPPINE